MSEQARDPHADALLAIVETRGLPLTAEEAAALARQSSAVLQEFRRLAARLRADDDMLAFRRTLEDEALRE